LCSAWYIATKIKMEIGFIKKMKRSLHLFYWHAVSKPGLPPQYAYFYPFTEEGDSAIIYSTAELAIRQCHATSLEHPTRRVLYIYA
jgi:hypothetical protein